MGDNTMEKIYQRLISLKNKLEPWLTGTTAKICYGLFAIITIAFLWAFLFTTSISDIAGQQLTAIKRDNLEKAYAYTSSAFQEHTSFEQFKTFVDSYPVLKNFQRVRFIEKRVDDGAGYLYGKLIAKDGSKSTIEFQLMKYHHEWKIQALRLAPASEEGDDPIADKSGASIHSIFINDTADAQGYTQQGKKTVDKNAATIYATVQVIAPFTGIDASAILTNVASGSKIGPSTGEITKAGNVLKAFSFTRDQNKWPAGEYEVEISLSTGAKKVVRFEVR
jgi:hypothetical protein